MTITEYVEKHGIKYSDFARALGVTPQCLENRRRRGWTLVVDGPYVTFFNPNDKKNETIHKLKGAKWIK